MIENFPEFKKGERNTSKHFNLLEELRRKVDSRKLYEVSELEQDLVTGPESRTKHMKAITDLVEQEIDESEVLRLMLLYALRYESDEKVDILKEKLWPKLGAKMATVNLLLEYAGK